MYPMAFPMLIVCIVMGYDVTNKKSFEEIQ